MYSIGGVLVSSNSSSTSSSPSTNASSSSSSTLVETVRLNLDDFSESFLTCATCLYQFDGDRRRPKLLSCSHTVCKYCLEQIVELPQNHETGTFRCPICRETILVPRGGVANLPPSFIVNQLLDLMSRQRRDVVPKCANHPNEELLFCETDDAVFCPSCTDSDITGGGGGVGGGGVGGGSVGGTTSSCLNHTVIPFSVAIKRMSEILLYKANQCVKNLNRAAENVRREMEALDINADSVTDHVNASFQELAKLLERRRHELIDAVRRTRDSKKKIMQEQLGIIQAEKAKVEQECQNLQCQFDVRSITRRIGDFNEKLDSSLTLLEPRENAYLRYEPDPSGTAAESVRKSVDEFGSLSVSKTFPPLCKAKPWSVPAVVHLRNIVLLTTMDYDGQYRTTGGDPVQAVVFGPEPDGLELEVVVHDRQDGTYLLTYVPELAGKHRMDIRIFTRPIKSTPLYLDIGCHNNPLWQYTGIGEEENGQLCQPVRVACSPEGDRLYVLDTGNNRVKSITVDGHVTREIRGDNLAHQSTVGLAIMPSTGHLFTLNWRTLTVTEWTEDGREIKSFTFSEFVEPLDLAIDSRGRILIADNGAKKIFVFDKNARPLLSFPVKTSISPINESSKHHVISSRAPPTHSNSSQCQVTCVAVGPDDDIVVGGGSQVQVYDQSGKFITQLLDLYGGTGGHRLHHHQVPSMKMAMPSSVIGGLAVDSDGYVLAAVTEKQHGSYVAVCRYKEKLLYTIDSYASKLRRPSGVCIMKGNDGGPAHHQEQQHIGGHCLVADLGNNCVKKYRYK